MAINFLDGISINGLSAQNSEATALTINSSNVVGTRELGSNAFNSTTIPTNTNQLTNGSGFLTSLSGAVLTTGTQTVAGAKTFSNQLTINEPAANGGTLRVERKSGNANITPPSSEAFMIIDSNTNFAAINYYVNQHVILGYGGGSVGIGTTTPTRRLVVRDGTGNAEIGFGNHPSATTEPCIMASDSAGNLDRIFQRQVSTNAVFVGDIDDNNGDVFFRAGGATSMTIKNGGNVGVGTTSPSQKLEVSGKAKITTSLAVGAITPSATTGRIDASNDVVAFSTSDVRLKDNIKSIDKALDKVNSIQGIEFDWIEKQEVHGNSGHDIGVIAQEIEKILPDVVTTRDSGYKAVKYEKIVPLLIEAIKDLSKQVDGLKRLI